ncbi:DUF6291 domain-containing protein [Bacteroides thetaiotaomicron]|jgi:hypothetical protein|uniref:DUF6291 domain-containing protein n=1 Tax=Bacteroides thetaiotaomicron TaxID=818 RepID=UPI00205CFF06|nr:MAG TPA: hypothetical protein [Caudoviricetes sp.]DAM09747.1 MAG TPA: hypothetical protein [Caudoviricetes sp.]DAY89679.1 MAG TPA: hypothetical protein [Caudoviricetes sp.]
MRDSFIFYRSFYEAIKDLPRDIQGEIYTAIMEYSLYGKETDNLKPVARSIFTLIKPQIDVNNKRFDNGCKGGRPLKKETKEKPSNNQKETKEKPNKNYNVNDNNNDNKESTNVDKKERPPKSDYERFNEWLKEHTPNVLKLQRQITEEEFLKLKKKYSYDQIVDILQSMENYKDAPKKYTSVYLTFLKWAKKEYGS